MDLLEQKAGGIYCSIADVYIDPSRKVKKALITHGHSDHARSGHGQYLSTKETVPILKHRLGSHIKTQGINYGEKIKINGVTFSFHPAGHVIGSAQIRVEHKGVVWVVSGDYKLQNDSISGIFEPIKCHHFITECTFGLPVFHWQPHHIVMNEINNWWTKNAESGRTSIIYGYSLGKTQRIAANVDAAIGPIYEHGAIKNTHDMFRALGYALPAARHIDDHKTATYFERALVFAPPSSGSSTLLRKFNTVSDAFASGWMMMRSRRKSFQSDSAFIMSDHADFNGLTRAVQETGAEHIHVTHGYTTPFQRWLVELGYDVKILEKK